MNRLGQLILSLQVHAQLLQDAQFRQETTQNRLHDAMEAGLNSSLAQISLIQGHANSLRAAVQDASQSVSQIASLAWIIRKSWKWGSMGVMIAVMLLLVFRLEANVARIAAAAIGMPFALFP